VDREEYNNSPSDMRAMDQFYRIDLDKETLNSLPENHYDVVVAAHVLEHLENPYEVLKALISKLKKGGKIYLEFPSLKSLGLPSMEGTLQFCDDTTHVSLLNPYDIANILLRQGITIRKARLRRDWIRLLTSPLFLLDNVRRSLSGKKARSRGLWDLTGFAYYVYGEKI
jgi:SAM-dependent methyltransferase